ncbi:hypothetical protein VNI00_018752 [Paramarasmius palmivorus]|uniref:CxC2-like cysteine cluster KDZ transposase-associated domain-containing protein n=1 Tax=Paramarasmius palmivorus TaxID=297713 RepID=A0AAW0AUN1_9AGAR
MSKRSRSKRPAISQYSAADFSSSSSESDNELQHVPKRSKDQKQRAFTSRISQDRRRIITKPISMGEPTPIKHALVDSVTPMVVDEAGPSNIFEQSESIVDSDTCNSSGSDSDREGSSDSEEDGSSSDSVPSAEEEAADVPWAGFNAALGLDTGDHGKQRTKKEQYLDEWLSVRGEYLRMLMIAECRGAGQHKFCHRCNRKDRVPRYRCRDCFSMELLCKECTLEGHRDRPLDVIENRYDSFRRAVREWRHLKSLKRGGRGNDGSRTIEETKPGELAVQCPACPHPGINLPSGWAQTEKKDRFIYTLFLAVDACFRLKRKTVSNEVLDPGFGTGWSYMVPDQPYRQYLKEMTSATEMSTCSGLAALDHANSRNARGTYATSGVGLGCCARHEFIQPNGVGDLQKGERYCNIDWILASILGHHDCKLKTCLSYDICCQYCKRFIERLMQLPEEKRPKEIPEFQFVIPKLHVYGHTTACQLYFSLNYALGVGRTDGEGVERNWAGQGPIATSTTEMGPGSRHDTLDDHWGYWNWQKLVGLGSLLLKRLKLAMEWADRQERFYKAHAANQAAHIPEWQRMVEEFEADSSKPNPYELPKEGITIHQVRAELGAEELTQTPHISLENAPAGPVKSAATFLLLALEVEERQRQIREIVGLKNRGSTARQTADIVDKRLQLRRLIARFEAQQVHFMPIVSSLRLSAALESTAHIEVEDLSLFLPSSLTPQQLGTCPRADLATIELRFRDAQCSEALEDLRNQLLIKTRLRTYISAQARHQNELRKSSELLQQNESKIRLHSKRYQAAWGAYRCLHTGKMPWRKLKQSHIRCMEDPEDPAVGVARKKLGKQSRSTGQLRAEEISLGAWDRQESEEGEESEDDLAEDKEEVSELTERQWKKKRDKLAAQTGEGFRKTSWIWLAGDRVGHVSDEALYNGLRVEWAKTYARLRRWREEVSLVKEEMRRTLVSLEWFASCWDRRSSCSGLSGIHGEGPAAYAYRQAAMYRSLAASFEKMWKQTANSGAATNRGLEEEEGDSEVIVEENDGHGDDSEYFASEYEA